MRLTLEERKETIVNLWRGKERGPVYYIGTVGREAPKGQVIEDFSLMLALEKERIAQKETIEDYDIPAIRTDFGTAIFPSAFGCPLFFSLEKYPWNTPIIFDDPSQVYRLEKPSVDAGLLSRVLEFTAFAVSFSTYPLRMTDLQGPIDTVYLMWESNAFFAALVEAKEAVHYLLDLVTDLIIDFVQTQKRIVGEREFILCHLPHYLPSGEGICVSEDLLALLSPPLYREFALPYLSRLSRTFGGVFIHSCGNFTHNLPVLREVEGLRGVNFGATETPVEEVLGILGGEVVVSPHVGLNKDIVFGDIFDYLDHLFRVGKGYPGLYVLVDTTNSLMKENMEWSEEKLTRIYRFFENWRGAYGQ